MGESERENKDTDVSGREITVRVNDAQRTGERKIPSKDKEEKKRLQGCSRGERRGKSRG